jgi:signal transduction histidine kinase
MPKYVSRKIVLNLIICLVLISSCAQAQDSERLNQLAKDSSAFNKFSDSCIASNSRDYLIVVYDRLIVDGKLEMQPSHLHFLQSLYSSMNRNSYTQNNYFVCSYIGRIISKYHLDENTPIKYFNESINIAKQLPNKCLVPLTYKYLSSFYSDVRHDLLKAYEYNNIMIAYFKQNKLNGIVDCGVDANIAASVISFYLEDYDRGIAQLNESIVIVNKLNKPKRLYDLYKRRSFYEMELHRYSDVFKTIDTAEMIIQNLSNKTELGNFINAIRFNVFANQGKYEYAAEYSKLVDAEQLKKDNDDYFDYMNNIIKMNIGFNQFNNADENINKYSSLLKPWNIQRWRKLYEAKYLLAKKTNDYKAALSAYEKFRYYDDSVHRQKQNLVIMDQQVKYETKEKDNLLKMEIKNNVTYRLVLLCISIMACIIIILIYVNFRKSKKSVKKLTSLNKTVNEQKYQVELALTQVEKANKDKDRILNVVAHDLRNPIGAIANFLDIAQVKYEHSEEEEQILKTSQQAAVHSLTLINDLLEVNQMQEGNLVLNKTKTNIKQLAEQSIDYLRYKAIAKQQTIILKADGDNFNINGDAEKLQRVITNLVDNAVKFSYIGKDVLVNIQQQQHHIEISITDSGVGIPPNIIEQLFTASITVKRKGTNNEKSNGLGLSICKQIIEAHNGKILVESEDGKGTCFTVQLPFA